MIKIVPILLLLVAGCQSRMPVYQNLNKDVFLLHQSSNKDILCLKDHHAEQWGDFRCFYVNGKKDLEDWKESVPTKDVRL